MNFNEAKQLLDNGKRVKLPEWTGWWFKIGDAYYAFTKTGDVELAWLDKYTNREDWEETVSGLGFDFAILALKSGKKVAREGWNKEAAFIFKGVGNTVNKDYIPNFKSLPKSVIDSLAKLDKDVVFHDSFDFVDSDGSITRGYSPSTQDMLAEDWYLVS